MLVTSSRKIVRAEYKRRIVNKLEFWNLQSKFHFLCCKIHNRENRSNRYEYWDTSLFLSSYEAYTCIIFYPESILSICYLRKILHPKLRQPQRFSLFLYNYFTYKYQTSCIVSSYNFLTGCCYIYPWAQLFKTNDVVS